MATTDAPVRMRPPTAEVRRSPTEVLRTWTLVAVLMLLVEFLLGMAANLIVTIPKVHPGSSGSSFVGRLVQ